jgi:hypothetical protein
MSQHGLRAFILSAVAALGLTALFAAGAQAEAGAAWMKNGANIASSQEIEATLETNANLLSTVGGTPLEIICKKVIVDDGLLEVEGKNRGVLLFTECETKLNKVTSNVCKPAEPIVLKALSLLVLHTLSGGAKDDLIEFFPHTVGGVTEPFARLKFSKLCTLEVNGGAGVPITGTFFAKDCENKLLEERATHLIEEARNATGGTLLGGLKFGVNPAQLDGSVNISLIGGGNFSGLLN